MSKRKLFILPVIVLVIVSILSISVLAASPTSAGFKVYKNNGSGDANDISSEFKGEKISAMDLSDISGLQDMINKVDKKVKVKDFVFKSGYEIRNTGSSAGVPWKVVLTDYKVSSSYIGMVIHKTGGKYEVNVFKGTGDYGFIKDVQSASPFYLYVAKVNSSAQTGDFVPAYVAMIAVALMSCGAIFAIRAKKAAK